MIGSKNNKEYENSICDCGGKHKFVSLPISEYKTQRFCHMPDDDAQYVVRHFYDQFLEKLYRKRCISILVLQKHGIPKDVIKLIVRFINEPYDHYIIKILQERNFPFMELYTVNLCNILLVEIP